MNFEIRKTTGKEEYQFFLVDKNKRILTSDKFASRDACTNTIKSLINAGGDANNYQIAQDGNDYFMTISAADGSPLALSSAFTTATEAEGLKQKLPNEFFDDREFEVTFVTTRVQRRKSTEKIEMYDLSYKSSGKKGFDTYKNGKIFYFAFNNDSGEIVLYGRAQKTGTKRKDDIWYIITKASRDGNYETKEADGGYYFIFKDRKGKEIARSVIFSSQELVNNSISTLKSSADNYKAEFSTAGKESSRAKRKKAGPNDDYDFTQLSKSGQYGFEAFRNEGNKGNYFHFNDDDGNAVLYSQNYSTSKSRDNGIRSVIKNGVLENRYVRKTKDGMHYFILKAGNNQEIARSKMFASLAEMNAFMLAMRAKIIGFAETYGLDKDVILSTIVTEKETFTLERDVQEVVMEAAPIEDVIDEKPVQKDDDYLKCEEYKGHPRSEAYPDFSTFDHGGLYYFALLNAADTVLLRSEGYTTIAARDNGIRSVLKNKDIEARRKTIEKFGYYFVILKAGNHQEIGRSCALADEAAAANLFVPPVMATAPEPEKPKHKDDDYLKCDEYKGHPRSETYPDFSTFDRDGLHYFALLNAADTVLLRSEGYTTIAARDNGIRSVLKNKDIEARRKIIEKFGYYFVILKAGNHQEIGRSCALADEAAAANLFVPLVMATAPEPEKPKHKDDDYLKCDEYKGHPRSEAYPDFSTFDRDGLHYFALLNAADTVLLRSEGYTTIAARDNGIRSVLKNKDIEVRRKIIEKFGYYFVILKAGNHQEIGRSCALADEAAAANLFVPLVMATVPEPEKPKHKDDDYLKCDEYKGHPRTEEYPDFSTFGHEGLHYFALLDEEDDVLLRSEGYTTIAARDNGIRSVLKNKDIEERRKVLKKFGYYFVILKAGNHQEIARSCALNDETAAWALLTPAALAATTPLGLGEGEEEPKDKEDDYLACKEYEGRTVNDKVNNVTMFKHSNGQFYFALYDENGNVKLRSEGFRTAKERDQELSGVLRFHDNPDMYERIQKGQYYMDVLRDENGIEVGRSCLKKDDPIAAVVPPIVPLIPVVPEEDEVLETIPEEPKDKEDDYLPCKEYQNRKINDRVNNVALFKHKENKQFYFALYDENGEVKLRSEGFATSQERDKELSGVLRFNKNPDMYERIQKGKYYMDVLRDDNGVEVGRSCLKKEEEGAGALVGAGLGAAGLGVVGVGDTPEVVEEEVEAAVPVVPVVPVEETPIVETIHEGVEEEVAAAGGAVAGGGGAGCMKYLPWLLLLALLALLLLWFLKGCEGCGGAAVDTTPSVTPPATTETEVNPSEDNSNSTAEVEAASGEETTPEEYEALGPDAEELGFAKGSVVAMMADCLADPRCEIPSKKFTLSIVHFGENDAHMNKEAYAEMDDLAKLMKAYPNMKIDIHGHIDNQESDVYDGRYQDGNITLSAIRARCVYRKLTDRGISGSRMTFKGHAATQPVTDGTSNEDRIRNRRVEVVISQR